MRNKSGPSIDPWGTPQDIDKGSDRLPFTLSALCTSSRYELNHFNEVPVTP